MYDMGNMLIKMLYTKSHYG